MSPVVLQRAPLPPQPSRQAQLASSAHGRRYPARPSPSASACQALAVCRVSRHPSSQASMSGDMPFFGKSAQQTKSMLCATCTVLSLGRVLIALRPHAPLFVILEPVPTSILELTTVGHGLDPIHARQGILIDPLPFAETTNDFDVSPEVRSQVIVNLGPSRLKPRLRHLRTAKAPLRASALLLALLKPALGRCNCYRYRWLLRDLRRCRECGERTVAKQLAEALAPQPHCAL